MDAYTFKFVVQEIITFGYRGLPFRVVSLCIISILFYFLIPFTCTFSSISPNTPTLRLDPIYPLPTSVHSWNDQFITIRRPATMVRFTSLLLSECLFRHN